MLNFDVDRKAKCDFTASTLNYWREAGAEDILTFWEVTSGGTLVPFGSDDASPQSRFDVFINYGGYVWYAVELKERSYPSTQEWTMKEGAFLNGEKAALIPQLKEKGYIPLWAELYTDETIRLWNLNRIDINSLQKKTAKIKKTTIDPNSETIMQDRYLLPVSASTTYRRCLT